ncbi:hypothetical protein [Moheibacter sp.]|uniref:hypothetical protein n=1 Tax=Moheibacter sp. TaxID=1965316 RepID=UPI003C7686D2
MRLKTKFYILSGFVFLSCFQKDDKKYEADSSFSQVYEMSEMALLMEEMYSSLEKIRPLIEEQKSLEEFPSDFNKIHTAEMTPSFERTDEFKRLADLYLQNLNQLYNAETKNPNRIEYFNNTVKSCITCHRSDAGCIGPVSRIDKLMIESERN